MSAGGHGGGGGSWAPLLEILGVIVLIWLAWFFTGGPQRAAQQGDMPFMSEPSSLGGNGKVYDSNGNAVSTPLQN